MGFLNTSITLTCVECPIYLSIFLSRITIKVHSDNVVITVTTTWKISPPPTDIPPCTTVISDCATPASAPVKEGTRAATIVHSQSPARRGSIVSVSSVIRDHTDRSVKQSHFFSAFHPRSETRRWRSWQDENQCDFRSRLFALSFDYPTRDSFRQW